MLVALLIAILVVGVELDALLATTMMLEDNGTWIDGVLVT